MKEIIVFKNVSKKYKSFSALSDVSLAIDKGDIFGIMGHSGAGKSTLLRCLARLLLPCSGQIFVNGQDICEFDPYSLRRYRQTIGMVFQHFNLLSCRDVEGNIAFPMELIGLSKHHQKSRLEELLDFVGLKHKRKSFPSQLSGGEKQRVGIARALATDPELLLCDEATSALDPKTTSEILDLLKKVNREKGTTLFLITHDKDVVRQLCNKAAVIEQGRIIKCGGPDVI